jgi:hypothetical protein
VRQSLCRDLGFSKEDRDKNIERVTFVSKVLTRNGVIVLSCFISPYRKMRDNARSEIGDFLEVFVRTPMEVLIERDVKGMYKKAMAGEIQGFTGVNDPYENPSTRTVLDTDRRRSSRAPIASSAPGGARLRAGGLGRGAWGRSRRERPKGGGPAVPGPSVPHGGASSIANSRAMP